MLQESINSKFWPGI